MDELAYFKVEKVAELTQPQRQEFVARLRELLNPDEAGEPEKGW